MAAEPAELGTLIVVVGKARHLPNLARFGKQDPFCALTVGAEKKKTKPIKRGGQHPEWDEELRFTILQDVDDILAASAAEAAANSLRRKPDTLPPLPTEEPGVVTPATMASKSRVTKTAKATKKTSKTMRVACYADDPKEPELIGEAIIPIDEVLKKGEIDDWYELKCKEKYTGEIYLECTFFSNATPPVKRDVPRPEVYNPNAPVRPQAQSATTGMNLYIPPYGKQPAAVGSLAARPPAAGAMPGVMPGAMPGAMPGSMPGSIAGRPPGVPAGHGRHHQSGSFSELGLPPQHTSTPPVPGQPEYPPGGHPGVPPASGIDSLTRPMMSMSLGPSYRPNGPVRHESSPVASQPPMGHFGTVSGLGQHRHSADTTGGPAPWAPLQEQHQPPPSQRPASAVEYGSHHPGQDPRMNGLHSVSPTPMGHRQSGSSAHSHHRTNSANLIVPGRESVPPQQGGYSAGGYGSSPAPSVEPHSYQHPSSHGSTPYPPAQSGTAPYTPPPNRRHSSYGPSYQATPPQPTPPQQQYPPQSYGAPPPQPSFNQTPQPYPPQSAQDNYPPVPAPPQKQTSGIYSSAAPYDPHRQRTDSFGNGPPVPGAFPNAQQPYPPAQAPPQPTTPAPQPPPLAQSPPKTSTGSAYVPWYMQTQQNAQATQSPPVSQFNTPPHPPAPPPARPSHVGYYPSDELYLQNQNQNQSPVPPPVPPPPGQTSYNQNQRPSPPPNNGYQAPPQSSYPPQPSAQPYPPTTPQQSYPPQNPPSQMYPPPNSQSQSSYTDPNASYTATPPPPPPRPQADAPWASLQQQPSYSNSPPAQSHTLFYAQQDVNRPGSAAPNTDFRPGTVAPDWNSSAGPHRVPSPLPPGSNSTGNRDWRSYLSSLTTTAEPTPPPLPPRVPSPNPPPRPYQTTNNPHTPHTPHTPQQQQQQSQDWYNTPPPAVPSSIMSDYRPQQQQWR